MTPFLIRRGSLGRNAFAQGMKKFKVTPNVIQLRQFAQSEAPTGGLTLVPRITNTDPRYGYAIKIRAESIMKQADSCVSMLHTQSVKHAVKAMEENEIGSVIVLSHDHKVVGIVTERDCLHKAENSPVHYSERSVSDVMTRDPKCATRAHNLDETIQFILENNTRHIPVVDCAESDQFEYHTVAEEDLIGMISVKDVIETLHEIEQKALGREDRKGVVNKKVSDMTNWGSACYSIGKDSTVSAAVKLMTELNIGALLVGHPKPAGIFTERDYLSHLAQENPHSKGTKLADVMSTDVTVVTPETTLNECIAKLFEGRFRHLPVFNLDGHCQGMLSIRDILRAYYMD